MYVAKALHCYDEIKTLIVMVIAITLPPSISKTKGPSGQNEELATNCRELTLPSVMLRKFTGEFNARKPGSRYTRETCCIYMHLLYVLYGLLKCILMKVMNAMLACVILHNNDLALSHTLAVNGIKVARQIECQCKVVDTKTQFSFKICLCY